MEHLKLFWSRISTWTTSPWCLPLLTMSADIPKVIKSTEQAHLWSELVFLYVHYDEFDNAALAMMERSADAWDHSQFKEVVVKVANIEIYYKALSFYLQEHPMLLNDLLVALAPRIDHTRVVRMFQKEDELPMIKPYLIAVQHVSCPTGAETQLR